jgi:hypothetical protein
MLYLRHFSKSNSKYKLYEFAYDRVSFKVYFLFGVFYRFIFSVNFFFHIKLGINSYIDKNFMLPPIFHNYEKSFYISEVDLYGILKQTSICV